jgi:type I restriction enzyme S subunit
MSKQDKQRKLAPRLRFPEFRGEGEWEEDKIGSLCRLYQPETLAASEFIEDGPFPVYGANGIIGRLDRYNHEESEVIVTCRGATCGEVHQTIPKAWITGNAMVVKPKDSRISKEFLFYFLKNNGLKTIISGSAQPQITRVGFSPLAIYFPHPAEQQKIADCLSSLEDLIAAEGRKLEALRAHKKGLMQQLFPREGETVPRLRFPEFRNKVGWERVFFSELFYVQEGFAFKSTDFINFKENATQVVRITDINNRNTNSDKVFIPNAFLESTNLGRYIVENGDLLLSLTGAAGFNFFFWNSGRAVLNQRTAKIIVKNKSNHALLRLLEPLIHEKINIRGEGQNNNLSKDFLNTLTILMPSPPEQQKIADCLSSLDELIELQTRKFEALKAHKKGLMQQLFPTPEDVE